MQKIKLEGYLNIPSERYQAVMDALDEHINLTRAEQGCISFNVIPCETVAHRLIVNELFTDQNAFDLHQKRTKASPWAQITENIERSYTISKV
jgi:quinol monooxygenase YgiN